MTVKTICQNALKEISGFQVPSTIIDNNDETAVTALAVLRREGMRVRKFDWVELIVEATITTVASQANYSKPTDFRKFANVTQWDRTNNFRMRGPTSPGEWQWLKGSVTGESATIERWFRIRGTEILVHPTPGTSGDTLAYEYYSQNWVTKASDSTKTDAPTADNDTVLLDEELLTLGVKWRFLKAKGIPWEAEYREYEDMLQTLLGENGVAGIVRLDQQSFADRMTNVPEQGFGLS